MAEKSKGSHETKKSGKSLKEKRAAKNEKQQAQKDACNVRDK